MRIGSRLISADESPYIIAEIGVNHDGDPDRAIDLVDCAAEAGVDAVKLQYFEAERLMGRAAALAAYQRDAGEQDPLAMLRRLELALPDMQRIVSHAHQRDLHAVMTVFSTELVEAAATLPVDAFKSASPDIIHKPLLSAMWETGRPLIISTGAASISEIDRAVRWLLPVDDSEEPRLAMLQCVSAYPTPDHAAALRAIRALDRRYQIPIGYSDHTSGADTGALAVAAGACILEKHLTWSRDAQGPDHAASLDVAGMTAYVTAARRAASMLGSIGKRVQPIERDVRRVSRQSLVAVRDRRQGEVLRPGDLTVQRPGGGVEPWRLEDVVGGRLLSDLKAGEMLCERHLVAPEPVS